MIRLSARLLFSAAMALGLSVGAGAAQGWSALVVGTPHPTAPTAFADAFHAGAALDRLGLGPVERLRDVPAARIAAALRQVAGQPRVLIYYAGPLLSDDGVTRLSGADRSTTEGLALPSLVENLLRGGANDIVLLLENCGAAGGGLTAGALIPDVPASGSVYLAATAADGAECPERGARVSDALVDAAKDGGVTDPLQMFLQQNVPGLWVAHDTAGPVPLIPADAPGGSDGFAIIDPDAPVATVPDDVVTLAPVAAPVGAQEAANAVGFAAGAARSASETQGEVVVFAAPDRSQQSARAVPEGLPEPSIIVGLIKNVTEASFSTVDEDPGDVTSNEIAYDDLDARRGLRDQDPEMFAGLVAAGAFDPPPSLLARALQIELQRMGCYTSGIDGIWGGGSRRSVQRYFAEIDGVEAETLQPETGLFRQIILQDEITCSTGAAVSSAAPRATRSQPTRSQPTRTQSRQPAQTQQSAPARQPQNTGRRIENTNTLGVFR